MTAPSVTDVEYDDASTRMIGALVVPPDVSGPAVLLLPDAYGVGDHLVDVGRRLGERGHPVLVADLWGERRQPADQAEFGPMIGALAADRDRWIGRVAAAHEALTGRLGLRGADVVLLGYCLGGSSALEYVRSGGDVAGAISVHGGLDILADDWSAASSAPVLVCTGEDDPMATPPMRRDLTAALDAAGNDWQLHVYSDTVHAFTSPMAQHSPRPDVVAYSARSTARAWEATLRFLHEVDASRPAA